MSEDQFTKLFRYMERRFDSVDKRFDMQDKKIDTVHSAVAELGGQIKDSRQEMILISRSTDRNERWIHEISKQTGIKLPLKG